MQTLLCTPNFGSFLAAELANMDMDRLRFLAVEHVNLGHFDSGRPLSSLGLSQTSPFLLKQQV